MTATGLRDQLAALEDQQQEFDRKNLQAVAMLDQVASDEDVEAVSELLDELKQVFDTEDEPGEP